MNHKQNLHTHSTYVDGKDRPEEMVAAAIRRGFGSIGFSEHTYLPYSAFPRQLTPDNMEQYRREIRELQRKYRGQLDIYCGLEYDFYSDADTSAFDYLIGSVHYLDCDGTIATFDRGLAETQAYIQNYFHGNALAFAETYFETVSRLPEKKQFDILGHFDLITKHNLQGHFWDVHAKEYLDLGFEAIHTLQGKIPFFEINTGAVSRGYKTAPYPQMEFIKEFHRLGFGLVITSDCHDSRFIDCFYDEAKAIAASAGFHSKWILTEIGFQEVRL